MTKEEIINKIESLRHDIEEGFEVDVINISVRLIEIRSNLEQLRQYNVSGRSEQLTCDTCKSGLIDYPEINRRTCRCGSLGYNVTD